MLELFHDVEDLEDTEDLHKIYEVFKSMSKSSLFKQYHYIILDSYKNMPVA